MIRKATAHDYKKIAMALYNKKIPYINWVEDVDWSTIYYKVYQSLLNETITDLELFNWDLAKILEVAADVRL